MFSNKNLKNLIIPLFIEQLLVMLVGIADTLMISYAGESAVSGVTLVNMFNTISVYLFQALAAGGAVVVSQYIGSKNRNDANRSSGQLTQIALIFSVVVTVIVLLFQNQLVDIFFLSIEADVRDAALTYLRISAYSYPALALYNVGVSLYRSMGKTNVTMIVSVFMNIINIVGNTIGIFVLHAGVEGVAWPSFISRMFAAIVMIVLCFNKKSIVYIQINDICSFDKTLLKQILNIAIPNAVENGLFQLAKVALSTIVARFGTSQIAANGVAQSIWSMAALVGVAMGPAYITVIGQIMGAGDKDGAVFYMKKLTKITLLFSIIWGILILTVTVPMLMLYNLPYETKRLIFILVLIHNIFNSTAFTFAGPFANGLRAAGDVKFTMYITTASTIMRVALSVLFGITLNMGVIGIAWAMVADWCFKGIVCYIRYKNKKWLNFNVINKGENHHEKTY